MNRVWTLNSQSNPPALPASLEIGYVKDTGGATTPGYWWYHMVTESLMGILSLAGLTPSTTDMTQLSTAIVVLAKANTITGALKPVRVIDLTGSVPYSGFQTIDGIALNNGDRVLSNVSPNNASSGIFVVNSSGAWSRSSDMAAGSSISEGTLISVSESTSVNAGTIWALNTAPSETDTVGTTPISFVNITASTQAMFANYLSISSAAANYLTQTSAQNTYLTGAAASATYLTQNNAASTYLTQTNAANTYDTISARNSALSAYLTTSSASSTYLTQSNASSTYLSQSTAASTYLTQSNASSTYLTQSNASSTYQLISSMSAYLTTSSASSTYLTQSSASSTYLSQSNASSYYLTQSNASSTYALISALSNYLTTSSAASTYATQSYVTGNPQMNSLGVGTAASGNTGEIRATGNIYGSYSDERMKEWIGKIENPLDIIRKFKVGIYKPNEYALSLGADPRTEAGMTTQDHEKYFPYSVGESGFIHSPERQGESPIMTLRYERDVPLLMAGMQDLLDRLDDRDRVINKLQLEVERLALNLRRQGPTTGGR